MDDHDALIAALKQAHDTLVHVGAYVACSQPGMSQAGLLSIHMAIIDCREALRQAEAARMAEHN